MTDPKLGSTGARRRGRHLASPLPFPVRVPFVESLGIELHGASPGHAELRVDLDEAHLNAWEVAHGGVVMTLMDVSMAIAARSLQAGGAASGGVATVEMKTSFLRPAEHQLRAVAKVLHRTSTLAFCEASLFDDRGLLCASASGTFKYLRGLPARGRVARSGADATPGAGPGTGPEAEPTTSPHQVPDADPPAQP